MKRWAIPLAICLTVLVFGGAYRCRMPDGNTIPCSGCGGGGGPTPTGTYKGYTGQRYHGDGVYGLDHTITGHVAYSNGTTRMFDTLYEDETIREECIPMLTVDMHTFGRPLVSPQTSYTEGGYATDPWDCVLGQALQWEWYWNWENASPYVPAGGGGNFRCTKIKAPPMGWGESYGWCEDD